MKAKDRANEIHAALLLQTLSGANWVLPALKGISTELMELAQFLFHSPDLERSFEFLNRAGRLNRAQQERVLWRFWVWILDGDLHPLSKANKEAKILADLYGTLLAGGKVGQARLRRQQEKVRVRAWAAAGVRAAWAATWAGAAAAAAARAAWAAWATWAAGAGEYSNLRTFAANRLLQFVIQEQEETKSK